MSTAARIRDLARDVVDCCRGHDLALYAAGVTFYAAIAVVPLLLLAVFLAGQLIGVERVADLAAGLAALLPRTSGAEAAATALVDAGAQLGVLAALAALVPATLYGEGLVRAFDRLSRHGDRGRRSLRGRAGSLLVVALSPVLLLLGLAAESGLSRALGVGLGPRLVGIYLGFLVSWLVVSALLAVAYRTLAPERVGARALAWGALSTGSFVAGTSLGWVLFLGIDLPVAQAYGGSQVLALAAVSALWLLLLHAMVLVGYVLTLRLQARDGRPAGQVVAPTAVREAA